MRCRSLDGSQPLLAFHAQLRYRLLMTTADARTRPRHEAFEFRHAELAAGHITLRYALTGGPDPDIEFREDLVLPEQTPEPEPNDPIVHALLDGIHRVFGVSYFKAANPRKVIAQPVCEADAAFWDLLYTQGMGEFYFRNELTPLPLPAFQHTQLSAAVHRAKRPAEERVLTLIGGGKDSMVAREIVRHAGVPSDGLAMGAAPWIVRSAEALDTRLLNIKRTLDPKLRLLNERGAYNGHVPISACIAFVSLLVAYLRGYSAVIVANERSADEGNTEWHGLKVNHQWSKSLELESGVQAWCRRHIAEGPEYFSLLRPLSEVRIAQAFSTYPAYFESFASCNANFRQNPQAEIARWCGHCPKCVFVQLIFAPWLDEAGLKQVFGRIFLADPGNRELLNMLTGITGIKPFECVGTAEESLGSLARLAQQRRLRLHGDHGDLTQWYAGHWGDQTDILVARWQSLLAPDDSPCLPQRWKERLHAYLGRDRS